jgi:AcrR family transcriptional regulator
MVAIVGEEGYAVVKVRVLSRRAGVSTRTFYQHFANVEECLGASYAWIMSEALGKAAAVEAIPRPEALEARLASLLGTFAEHPNAARLALFETCGAGPTVADKERGTARALERLVRDDLGAAPDPFTPSWYLLRGIVGAILWVARCHASEGGCHDVDLAARELSEWALILHAEFTSCIRPLPCSVSRDRDQPRRWRTSPGTDGRRRLLDAAARLAARDGYGALTGPAIRREAGIARRVFDANFSSVEDCFLEAVEAKVFDAVERVKDQAVDSGDFPVVVETMIGHLCSEVPRDPDLARLMFVDLLTTGRHGLDRQDLIVKKLAGRLSLCGARNAATPPLAAGASLAASWAIVQAEVSAGRADRLEALAAIVSLVCLAPTTDLGATRRMDRGLCRARERQMVP